jgi:hypothetical protein
MARRKKLELWNVKDPPLEGRNIGFLKQVFSEAALGKNV